MNGKPLGSDDPEEKVPVQEVKHNIIKLIRQRYHHYLYTNCHIYEVQCIILVKMKSSLRYLGYME